MFRTLRRKFYAIAGGLLLFFLISQGFLAYFLKDQGRISQRERRVTAIERESGNSGSLFFELRFWERAVLSGTYAEADQHFGEILKALRGSLKSLRTASGDEKVAQISARAEASLGLYEKLFNRMVQLKTLQRLGRTQMDVTYRSLLSNILESHQARLYRPLFNLSHFQMSYRQNPEESEYLALKLVLDSLERKIRGADLSDERMMGYLDSYASLLREDYKYQGQIRSLDGRFNEISLRLMDLLSGISRYAHGRLDEAFSAGLRSRRTYGWVFGLSSVAGVCVLLLVLYALARKVIRPIRSLSEVMARVEEGKWEARVPLPPGDRDEIHRLGVSFNRMLDVLAQNNDQLLAYQKELEDKVTQLASREQELEQHRHRLEDLVDERTTKLKHTVEELEREVEQRRAAQEELRNHQEALEDLVRERTEDLLAANRELEEEMAQRKRAEEERLRLEIQLQRAKKMEAIGTLAGGVAHDLNNILSGIVSYPELLLLDLPEDSPMVAPIRTIMESGRRAAAIVQDLLTLARRGVTQREPVDLNRVVSDYMRSPEFEKVKSEHPDVRFEVASAPGTITVLGSPVHLSKTLMNLVSNAAEAMPEGGRVRIATENRYVDRPIGQYDRVVEGDYAVLCVSDTGVGISPEDMEHIFEPFFTKKKMGRSGTGLGMAVVWGTVKDHSGYIDVKSTPGEGSLFEIYLPLARTEEVTGTEAEGDLEAIAGHGEFILVVDDVPEQREIASRMLRRLGYEVEALSSGEEAVRFLETRSADLVVLDMIMPPGIDGLETFRRIQAVSPGQKAIIASGFSETARVKEAQKLGVGAYVRKPYTLEGIAMAVRQELDRHGPEAPGEQG